MQIEMWEQEHAQPFVVNGQKFVEYVTEQWEMHRLEKERAKQERVREPSSGRGGGGPGSSHSPSAHGSSGCRGLAPALPQTCFLPGILPQLLLTVTQQLKNKKQTETEMLYGSAPRTPSKRRGLAPATPGKVRKVNGRPWAAAGEGPGLGAALPSVGQVGKGLGYTSAWSPLHKGASWPFSLYSYFITYKRFENHL